MEFKDLYIDQANFTKKFIESKHYALGSLSETGLIEWTKEYCLSMINEVTEILNNIDWKRHRRKIDPTIRDNVIEEFIDLQKFLWGLMTIWGLSVDEIIEAYQKKSFVVEDRLRQELIEISKPILLIDLDGVLCEYPESFLNWVRNIYPEIENISKKKNPLLWERLKSEYRQTGGKQEAIVVPGAKTFLDFLRGDSWSIVVFTYRPIAVYKNIEYDTIKWLKDNELYYDKIVWASREKSFYLSAGVLDCDLFIDDDIDSCISMKSLNKNVYCRSSQINDVETFINFEEVLKRESGKLWQYLGI